VAEQEDREPPKRPTREELAERVELARHLLAMGCRKSYIKKRLRKKYGDLDHATIERYLTRAREEILAATGVPRPEHRGWSLAFYGAIRSNLRFGAKERLKAQERIDKLLGLEDKSPPDILEQFLASLPAELARALRAALSAALSPGATAEGGGDDDGGRLLEEPGRVHAGGAEPEPVAGAGADCQPVDPEAPEGAGKS